MELLDIVDENGNLTGEVMEKYAKGNRSNKSRSKSNDSKSSRNNSKKRKKKEIEDEDEKDEENYYSDEVIKKMMKNNKLKSLTVQELKDICKIRNIATKGLKKADILEKLKNYLEDQ